MRILKFIHFFFFYLYEIILCNLKVAYDVLTPKHYMKPGFIAVELDDMSDLQISILANLLTMTPGTLSLDVCSNKKSLYIHAMYIDDQEKLLTEIKENYIKRIKEVFP
ncbi:MAG: Na+/H+ antiporter subunit E [Verrucomicrobiota bacterium]